MSLFHEMYQNRNISVARAQASSANLNAKEAQIKLTELESKLEMSLMVSEALWGIIKQSLDLDDTYLAQLVKQIDMKDGRVDGKVAKTIPDNCNNCGKVLLRGKTNCMYCGQGHEMQPFKR